MKHAKLSFLGCLVLLVSTGTSEGLDHRAASAQVVESDRQCGLGYFERLIGIKLNETVFGRNLSEREIKKNKQLIYEQIMPPFLKESIRSILSEQGANFFAGEDIRNMLTTKGVVVRLNVLHDVGFAEDLEHYGEKPEEIIRLVLREVQMYYWKPDVTKRIKIKLVVVALKQMSKEYDRSIEASIMINYLHTISPTDYYQIDRADLNLVIMKRHIFELRPRVIGGILGGMANLGTFCLGRNTGSVLLVRAGSLGGMARDIAHELGHALGVFHDGDKMALNPIMTSEIESKCSSEDFLMSPTVGERKLSFSSCSVEKMIFVMSQRAGCAFDESRIRSAVPISAAFDFIDDGIISTSVDADRTCKLASDLRARSLPSSLEGLENCQKILCLVDPLESDDGSMHIGPAISGTPCEVVPTGAKGLCQYSKCLPTDSGGAPVTSSPPTPPPVPPPFSPPTPPPFSPPGPTPVPPPFSPPTPPPFSPPFSPPTPPPFLPPGPTPLPMPVPPPEPGRNITPVIEGSV